MSTSQVIILVVIIAALGGSMTFYMMQAPFKLIAKDEANCTAVAAALSLKHNKRYWYDTSYS